MKKNRKSTSLFAVLMSLSILAGGVNLPQGTDMAAAAAQSENPMLRRDAIEAAGKKQNILFPIFTNGTYLDESFFALFDKCRNLVPVMSIEGNRETTDLRRGAGIYDKLIANMEEYSQRRLIFGAWGCGVYGNDARVISDLFRSVLNELDYHGFGTNDLFSRIDFAVPDRTPAQYNYQHFLRNFAE